MSLVARTAWSLCLAWLVTAPAPAAEPVAPQNVIHLSASASVDVAKDMISVVFSTTREGPDAAAVQGQLRQALDAALAEARKAAKAGQIEVQTGNFSLYPRHDARGVAAGWTGTVELMVEGRDLQGVSQLAGRIQTLTIARVGYGVSREAREQVEGDVTATAIGRWRAKAEQVARQFGFAGYALREVQVSTGDSPPPGPVPMMRAQAAPTLADGALPVEAGKSQVSASVSGSIVLSR